METTFTDGLYGCFRAEIPQPENYRPCHVHQQAQQASTASSSMALETPSQQIQQSYQPQQFQLPVEFQQQHQQEQVDTLQLELELYDQPYWELQHHQDIKNLYNLQQHYEHSHQLRNEVDGQQYEELQRYYQNNPQQYVYLQPQFNTQQQQQQYQGFVNYSTVMHEKYQPKQFITIPPVNTINPIAVKVTVPIHAPTLDRNLGFHSIQPSSSSSNTLCPQHNPQQQQFQNQPPQHQLNFTPQQYHPHQQQTQQNFQQHRQEEQEQNSQVTWTIDVQQYYQ